MSQVKKAAKILNSGGIVIFPTETVYGIGCLINKEDSIKKLYSIKKRDSTKPTAVLVKDLQQAEEWVSFNTTAKKLAEAFWPGHLTLCLPVCKQVSESIVGPGDTLGVRVSSHPFILQLQRELNVPLLAPSANFQGKQEARTFAEIDKQLLSLVDYVVGIEPEAKKPSTILAFEKEKYNLLREGEISSAQIEQALRYVRSQR